MVRLNQHEQPMDRQRDIPLNPIQLAGVLCRDQDFIEYLFTNDEIVKPSEDEATSWLRQKLGVQSRAELKANQEAQQRLFAINQEFNAWKRN
jgi:hypothetical protein